VLIDAHLHCSGRERSGDVLRSLDDAGVDLAVLLAPFLDEGYSMHDAASLRRANRHLAAIVRAAPERLVGFAVVNPALPGAADDLAEALDLGLSGAKMVPSGWYPEDPRVQPTFEVAARHALPLLFHSGIFIDGRSSRFCRPAGFEPLRDHAGVRVALAHLGWPWTDEAIALGLIDRIHGVPPADAVFRFDLSFGAPPPYRHEAIRRALEVLGPECLQFGSDCFLPCPGEAIAERHRELVEVLDALDVDAGARAAIFGGTALAWLRREPVPLRDGPARAGATAARRCERSRASTRGWLGARTGRWRCCRRGPAGR
jgi:predicted TIM-barrel fold metal-dependent hydrolase